MSRDSRDASFDTRGSIEFSREYLDVEKMKRKGMRDIEVICVGIYAS
jgi:hypothetical protein